MTGMQNKPYNYEKNRPHNNPKKASEKNNRSFQKNYHPGTFKIQKGEKIVKYNVCNNDWRGVKHNKSNYSSEESN